MRKEIVRWAHGAAKPVRWRQVIALGAAGLFIWSLGEGEWDGALLWFLVMIFCLYLRNRHNDLAHFEEHGVDPYDEQQVEKHQRAIRRKLYERGITPPD